MKSPLRCVSYKAFAFREMPTGSERRLAILDHILIMNKLPVNRTYCQQVHEDVDLKKMIKAGTLKQVRIGRKTSKCSYLVLNKV